MSIVSETPKSSNWHRFRTADPRSKTVLLDVGRAEVMLNMIVASDLKTEEDLREFIGAVHSASNGDPAVLTLLIEAFQGWEEFDTAAARSRLRKVWSTFDGKPRASDCVRTLRRICSEQSFPLPNTMIEALFDDLSFDFIAYLKWHNRDD